MHIDLQGIEQEIVNRNKAANIRLRFDKVVLRLVGGLQSALTNVVPDEEAVIFTVSAPIRLPAKTAAVLESLLRDDRRDGERREVVHGNQVRIRRLTDVPLQMPKVLGFVHDPASDAGVILDLAEARLFEQNRNADDAGSWSDPDMKNRYRRDKQRNVQTVARLRQRVRKNDA